MFNEFFQPYISSSEKEQYGKFSKNHEIREEYEEGRLKLEGEITIPEGGIIKAHEDEHGIALIEIENSNGKSFNIADRALAPEIRLITPTYILQHPTLQFELQDERLRPGQWFAGEDKDGKFISVGDLLNNPSSIFVLLHEGGHTLQDKLKQKVNKKYQSFKDTARFSIENKKIQKEFMEYAAAASEDERGAWLKAIRTARKIQQNDNVNLFSLFKNPKELKELMYGALLTHRTEYQEWLRDITAEEFRHPDQPEDFLDKIINRIFNYKEIDPYYAFDDLFDKKKLQKKL